MRSFLSNTPRDSNENVFVIGCFQNNKIEKRWWREKSYPVSLHRVALSLKSLQQRLAWVPPASEAGDEPTPGDTGRPGHCPLQVSSSLLHQTLTFIFYYSHFSHFFKVKFWSTTSIFSIKYKKAIFSLNFWLTISFLKIFWQFQKF